MAKSKKPSNPVSVDIISDVVCPWCWLGKKYFDEAVRKSGRKIDVVYRPYMLDPNIPLDGVAYDVYMKQKFGGGPNDKFKIMREHLEAAAPDVGITFKFGKIPMRPNSLRAHQLIRWARGQDVAPAVKEAIMKAFFEELRDIGDIDVLADIAGKNGMDADLTRDLLTDGQDADSVREEALYFRGLGVSGVPTFIYNGQFAVQGAQPVSVHLDAIKQAATLPIEAD